MNIESTSINKLNKQPLTNVTVNGKEGDGKFLEELKGLEQAEVKEEKVLEKENSNVEKNTEVVSKKADNANEEISGAMKDLNNMVREFNQSDDKNELLVKGNDTLSDNNNMINKDYNIQENKEILPQMNPNMNFSGDGQPFSSFMNNDAEKREAQKTKALLGSSVQELAEEAAILSTMAENIAIANKNQLLKETMTVSNEEGVKRVEYNTGIKLDTVVKYDSIIMNEADVEVFVQLVEKGTIEVNNFALEAASKSVQVSKVLANMLAKAMENNQPVRIDFDNNISIIIRISRDGKISADFLPSSQVAEAYLKENLPLLRQRFDENNIKYDELNQRERKEQHKENHRKKGRNNE